MSMINLIGDTEDVIARFKEVKGFSTDKQLATFLGISQQDFFRRKQRGSIIIPIINQALFLNVNINWLLTGVGNIYTNDPVDFPQDSQDLMIIITEVVDETLSDLNIKMPWKIKRKMIRGIHEIFMNDFKEKKKDNLISMDDYLRNHKLEIKASIAASAQMAK